MKGRNHSLYYNILQKGENTLRKNRRVKQGAAAGLASILLLSNPAAGFAAQGTTDQLSKLAPLSKAEKTKVTADKEYKDSEKVRVIVELEGEPAITYSTKKGVRYKDLAPSKQKQLQANVKEEQSDFLSDLRKKSIKLEVENSFTTVVNGVSGEIQYGEIKDLEKLPNVSAVSIVNEYERPKQKPDMLSSKGMVEAIQTWNAGYNGEGMVVGIIDTGLDYTHKDMVLGKETKTKLSDSKVGTLINENKLDGKFYTDKIPFGYNYADKNSEIRDLGPDASMHGMHVGGTVGANGDESGNGIKGVAPESQLLALKVFGNDQAMPSTFGDIYIKAIDDGIILGADVLNMSLGSTAGFVDENSLEQQAVNRAVENGVLMSISAGNSAYYASDYANPLASNPDIGLVGAPGLSADSISVASMENDKIALDQMIVTIGSEEIPTAYKKQSSPDPEDVFGNERAVDVVYVGDGSPAQYAGKDVKDKVVFAVRFAAAPNYGEIQKQAEAAGAAGVIIRGTAAHGDYVSMALNNPVIPLVSLGVAEGTALETKIKAAGGTAKVVFNGKKMTVVNTAAGTMSTFSSWGVTPSLEMKPELTAPGGQIYSTLNDDKYGLMNGTSMAAPHVSGGAALVLQKVQEDFPELKGADKVKRAKTILMNTAKVVTDASNSGLPYSPRLQGAGLMQLNAAVTTPVYVTAKGSDEGKFELKEIGSDQFSMTVTATNFSDKEASYTVGANVLADKIKGIQTELKEQLVSKAKISIDTEKLVLPAGGSKDVTVKVDLSEAKAELEAAQKNGYFVEGYISLTNDSQDSAVPNLSVPYIGFKGDWNAAPVLDPLVGEEGESFYGVAGMVDTKGTYVGRNPFTKEYSTKNIAISPNGDGQNDGIAPVLTFLRNSKTVEYAITDAAGKTVRKLKTDKDQRKNYSAASPASYRPSYTLWDGKVNNKVAADGAYYYEIKTQVDYPGKPQQVKRVPVIVDNTAPSIKELQYNPDNGELSFKASDANGSGLQYIEIAIDGKSEKTLPQGESDSYQVALGKLSKDARIQVTALDYAFNHDVKATSGSGDSTIPYIFSDIPEATGVYDSKDVPFSGHVVDSSSVDYLTVKGDKLNPASQKVALTYNADKKYYEFNTVLHFTEDGSHEFFVEAEDAAGHKIEFRRQVMVDTTAPEISVDLADGSYVSEDPKVKVTVSDNFDDVRLLVNGSEEYYHEFDYPLEMRAHSHTQEVQLVLEEGMNEVVFEVQDLGGHSVKKTIKVEKGPDVTAPDKPTVNAVSDKDKKVTGKAEADSSVTVKAGKTVLGTGTATAKGTFSIAIKAQKAGTKLSVTAADKAGNVSKAATVTVSDKTAPAAPKVDKVSDKDKKVTGTAEAGSKVTVKAGSTVLGSATADKKGKFSVAIKAQKAGKTLTVTAKDKAGNTSASKKVTVLDKTPPAAPTVSKVTVSSKKVTGKAEAGSTVYVKSGSKVLGKATASKSGSYKVTIKKQKAGKVLSVYAKDKAGNTSKVKKTTVKKK